ncbi:hypothetical protein AB0J38_37775 [Streptomyces sp. NPDC050095]|uniref:hypothetical protein n=1 Tax=unclassified Streptomyces TaxID=2593676 RepID=UPI003414D848
MKRDRATELLCEMLTNLDGGERPLDLVDSLHVFGSYARGALEPADVDVAVTHGTDEDFTAEVASAMFSGADPMASMKRALRGRRRGVQFQFNQNPALTDTGIELTLLWQRGDILDKALARLDALAPAPDAGRAPRDDMIEQFEGLDRWIPRPVRGRIIELLASGAIELHRVTLPDATPASPMALQALDRWTDDSPLRRAASAALALVEQDNPSLKAAVLQGQVIRTRDTEEELAPGIWIDLGWRHFDQLVHQLRRGGGWIEVIRPTRKQPLDAFLITVRDTSALPRW